MHAGIIGQSTYTRTLESLSSPRHLSAITLYAPSPTLDPYAKGPCLILVRAALVHWKSGKNFGKTFFARMRAAHDFALRSHCPGVQPLLECGTWSHAVKCECCHNPHSMKMQPVELAEFESCFSQGVRTIHAMTIAEARRPPAATAFPRPSHGPCAA